MRILILKKSQVIETIAGSIMIMIFVYMNHRHGTSKYLQRHPQRILLILGGSVGIWIFSWVVRKISVNIYHSYLQATNQEDKEFIIHLPFLYEYVNKEHLDTVQSVY